MDTFTQGLYNMYFAKFSTTLATSPEIEALLKIDTPAGDKLLKQTAFLFADKFFQGKVANPDNFLDFISDKPRFSDLFNRFLKIKEDSAKGHEEFLARQA
jgi:hypothetical protein